MRSTHYIRSSYRNPPWVALIYCKVFGTLVLGSFVGLLDWSDNSILPRILYPLYYSVPQDKYHYIC